jgi:scyllo-inositol 2-dehydrogenase (NADP+)
VKNPDDPHWREEPKEQWGLLHLEKDKNQFREKYETIPGNYGAFYDNIFESIALEKN